MGDRRPVRGGFGPSAIEAGLEDRADRGVGAGADLERAPAGRLEPVGIMGAGQPQDAEAGAEALLGVAALAQDRGDQRLGAGACAATRWPSWKISTVFSVTRAHTFWRRSRWGTE